MISGESLRYDILSEESAKRLYKDLPVLRKSYEEFCPTCQGTKSYRWKGVEHECDCQLQLQLHKHYLNAGIGVLFQRLDWEDYVGDPQAKENCEFYIESHKDLVHRGTGFIFYGSYGVGKTLALTLLLKDLLKLGYSVYSTTFASLIESFTTGWHSPDEQKFYQNSVKRSQILLVDDIGKEFQNRLAESTLDDVLRSRVQSGRVTMFTSNMTPDEVGERYGRAIFSLLREVNISTHVRGIDFREKAQERSLVEVSRGEIRPIV